MIRSLVEETGAKIDVSDDGTISIATASSSAAEAAVAKKRRLFTIGPLGSADYLSKMSAYFETQSCFHQAKCQSLARWDERSARAQAWAGLLQSDSRFAF